MRKRVRSKEFKKQVAGLSASESEKDKNMPTLHWVGKNKVVNHHHEVPFRLLDKQYSFKANEGTPANSTNNKIIHGDNLEALKSLRRDCKLHAAKTGRKLKLVQEKYQKNPFNHWKDNLTTPAFCISAIPFVRNLAEYCGLEAEFLKLTSLLHVKGDTDTMTLDELCTVYKRLLADKQQLALNPQAKPVIELINEEAEAVFAAQEEAVELEGKIVLSIAIRLLAERHMIRTINNPAFVGAITENQTIKLLQEYKRLGLGRAEDVLVLEQVNLMTPENIHLNSFMYEPILDLGIAHLKALYAEVKLLP